ncbi:hypothetical protein NCAS_0H03550 [Naumovozyma castellii]|uniref:Uncharacterized protein n=1 Tax=Naumovozyma castellii TaxID=27288 RepID=G0VJI5_NAUCA|nr:hypothetical protein NCAS_0H03550 [Naumovozyma castellii CBS 4309]CCC71665.1 hypothetical protein NCAS_0H03550 [Naumovozyma castellii CBS 4309]
MEESELLDFLLQEDLSPKPNTSSETSRSRWLKDDDVSTKTAKSKVAPEHVTVNSQRDDEFMDGFMDDLSSLISGTENIKIKPSSSQDTSKFKMKMGLDEDIDENAIPGTRKDGKRPRKTKTGSSRKVQLKEGPLEEFDIITKTTDNRKDTKQSHLQNLNDKLTRRERKKKSTVLKSKENSPNGNEVQNPDTKKKQKDTLKKSKKETKLQSKDEPIDITSNRTVKKETQKEGFNANGEPASKEGSEKPSKSQRRRKAREEKKKLANTNNTLEVNNISVSQDLNLQVPKNKKTDRVKKKNKKDKKLQQPTTEELNQSKKQSREPDTISIDELPTKTPKSSNEKRKSKGPDKIEKNVGESNQKEPRRKKQPALGTKRKGSSGHHIIEPTKATDTLQKFSRTSVEF